MGPSPATSTLAMEGSTGKRSWQVARPVAELHWQHTAAKYGFTETKTIRRYWKSSCTRVISVSLLVGNHLVLLNNSDSVATSGDERMLIPYTNAPQLRAYLRHGYLPSSARFACKRGAVGVLKLVREDPSMRPNSYVLVCIDTQKLRVLGAFPVVGYGRKTEFQHVEVYGLSVSGDGRHVALSLGLVHARNLLQEAFENAVVVYNCATTREVFRVNVGPVIAAVAFDPRPASRHTQLTVAGVPDYSSHRDEVDSEMLVATYDVASGQRTHAISIGHLLDEEEEMHLELSYHADLLVVQTLEPMGYSQEWLYKTWVYNADSMQPIAYCEPGLLFTCHPQCMPVAAPQVSPCGAHLAMPNYCANIQKADVPIKVFRLPVSLSLKTQCRAAIVRLLCKPADVHTLPLPHSLKAYLSWKESKRADKAPVCQCPPNIGGVAESRADTKDASWYTTVDDVTSNPELSEIPLHPRARNETYS